MDGWIDRLIDLWDSGSTSSTRHRSMARNVEVVPWFLSRRIKTTARFSSSECGEYFQQLPNFSKTCHQTCHNRCVTRFWRHNRCQRFRCFVALDSGLFWRRWVGPLEASQRHWRFTVPFFQTCHLWKKRETSGISLFCPNFFDLFSDFQNLWLS